MRDRSQARCVLVQPQVATVLVIVADVSLHERCLRCLLLVMCTYPCAKKSAYAPFSARRRSRALFWL